MNPVTPDYSAILRDLVNAVRFGAGKDVWDVIVIVMTGFSAFLVAWSVVLTRRMQTASDKQVQESIQQRQVAEKMLDEQKKQHLLEMRPIITFDFISEDHSSPHAHIWNLGRGPAFHVSITASLPTTASRPTDNPELIFSTVQWLGADRNCRVPFVLRWGDGEREYHVRDIADRFGMRLSGDTLLLQMTYSDLYGNPYAVTMDLAFDEHGRHGVHYHPERAPPQK